MFQWQFASAEQRPKIWYVGALIVVSFFIVYGILASLYILSVVTFLVAGVYILLENNNSPVTTVSISENIIQVNTTVYEISKIEKFAIMMDDEVPYSLRLFFGRSITPVVDIPFTSEVDGFAVRDFLQQKVSYDPHVEFTQGDRIMHFLGL